MWFRLLVVLAVAGPGVVMMASVSSRDESNTEDGVHLEPLPLILAAPSKVARANKLKENEVNNALSKLMTLLPNVVPTIAATTASTTTTEAATTSTTTTETPKTTTEIEQEEIAEKETETESTTATATSTATLNPTVKEAENKSSEVDTESLDHDSVTTAEGNDDTPSSTWGFFNIKTDATPTNDGEENLKETDRDVQDEEATSTTVASVDHKEATSTESESASSTKSTASGVAEHDYSELLETTKSQKVAPEEEQEEPAIVDRGLNIPPSSGDNLSENEEAFVDEPVDLEVAEDRLDTSKTVDQEPEAEGSEVFYSLATAPRTRALHGDDISVATSDFVPVAERRSSDGMLQPDVQTSMTYSVAVLHPLGSFSEPPTVPYMRRSDPSELATDDLGSFGRLEDDLPVEVDHTIANNATEEEEEEATETSYVATTTVQSSNEDTSTSPSGVSKNLFYNKHFQPGKETETDKDIAEDKDLVPAESVQDSAAVVDPLGSSPVDVDQNGGGEEDYEYVYEYVDLNSTDIPDDLPEGAFVVTDDNSRIPITSLKTTTLPTTAEPRIADQDQEQGQDEGQVDGPTLSPDGLASESLSSPLPTEFLLPHATSSQAVPALAPVTQASAVAPNQLPFIPGMPDSPVYFVGIQREKMTPGTSALPKETPSEHNSLVSLYALSRALPLDEEETESSASSNETKPVQEVTVADTEIANLTEASVKVPNIPAELPDPFDEEFLHGSSQEPAQPLLTAVATEEALSAATPPPPPPPPSVEPVEPAEPPKPVEDSAAITPKHRPGARPTGRPPRRHTTTTATTEAITTTTTAHALTEETTVAANGRRPGSGRPAGRFSRRRSTTSSTSPPETLTSAVVTEASAATSTERPRSAFGQRGRGGSRFSSNRNVQSTENGGKPIEKEKEKDNDVGTVATKPQSPVSGRRTPVRNHATTTSPETSSTAATTAASRPSLRRRRPTTSGGGAVTQKPKAGTNGEPTSPIPNGNSDATTGEATTTGRRKLFGSRGRSRLAPKLKPTDSPAGEEHTDQHEASSDTPAPSTEHPPKEDTADKVASEDASAAEGAAGSGGEGAVDAEVATTTEEVSAGHRRFPPRKLRLRSNGNGPKSAPGAN